MRDEIRALIRKLKSKYKVLEGEAVNGHLTAMIQMNDLSCDIDELYKIIKIIDKYEEEL